MIDPATAKIIGWMGRVVAVALLVAICAWYAKLMIEEEEKENDYAEMQQVPPQDKPRR